MASFDPEEKKKHAGATLFRSLMKILLTIMLCGGALVAFRIQQKGKMLIDDPKQIQTTLTNNDLIKQQQTPPPPATNANEEDVGFSVATPKTQQVTTTKKQVITKAVKAETNVIPEDENKPTSNPGLTFSVEKPVLVLSLPHNGDLAIARYFKCGGVAPQAFGRYWSTHAQVPLGRCLQSHMDDSTTTPITHNCGAESFEVWSELHMIEPAKTKGIRKHEARCFDPVLFPNALHKLREAIPNAYVLVVKQSFGNWYNSMPKDLKAHWKKYCNPSHNQAFPANSHSKTQYEKFYNDYHEKVRNFVNSETTSNNKWTLLEIDLDSDYMSVVGNKLEDLLNIPSKCWLDSVEAPLKIASATQQQQQIPQQKRPNTIPYPILSVGLPKGGDGAAHNYFQCGLGLWATVQQWTTPSKSTEEHPLPDFPIGKCIEDNVKNPEGINNILKGCGHARFWGDIGYLRDQLNGGHCFYPTLTQGVLEKFVEYYPRATILHVVRPAQDWYKSTLKNNNLPARWTKAQNCPGFPPEAATVDDWYNFYNQHAQDIRTFVTKHIPNITYLEIPLSKEGGELLQDIFSFQDHCWGKGNIDNQ